MKALETLSRFASNVAFKAKKNSPELLMAAGAVTLVGAVVTAALTPTKAKKVLEEYNDQLAEIHECEDLIEQGEEIDYSEQDAKIDKVKATVKMVGKMIIVCAPVTGLVILTLLCFFGAYSIINTRYIGAVAAYNGISAIFGKYRGRVREKEGDDADEYYMYGTETKKIKETVVDEEGNKTKKEIIEKRTDIENLNIGVDRIFDDRNPNWDPNEQFVIKWFKAITASLQDILDTRGHLFLNEIYEALGYEHTPEGAVLGILSEKNGGIGKVDLGFNDVSKEDIRNYVNGRTDFFIVRIGLEDDVIWDKIGKGAEFRERQCVA